MKSTPIFAIVEFDWHGDLAVPISLCFVYDKELATGLVEDELEGVIGRAAYIINQIEENPVKLMAEAGIVPSSWQKPSFTKLSGIIPI